MPDAFACSKKRVQSCCVICWVIYVRKQTNRPKHNMGLIQRKQMQRMISNLSKHKRATDSVVVCQWWPDGHLLFTFDEQQVMQLMGFFCDSFRTGASKHTPSLLIASPFCPLVYKTGSRVRVSTCKSASPGSHWNSCFATNTSSEKQPPLLQTSNFRKCK